MVESLSYDTLVSGRRFEVRQYPLTVLATVRGLSDDEAFSILFSYISGNNSKKERVPMTTPVVSRDPGSSKIPMTTPVVSDAGSFSFAMPDTYTPQEVPEPRDPRVAIEVLPARRLAVLRFRGRTDERTVSSRSQELLHLVRGAGLVPKGEPFLMRYNPPFVPGFMRRNEVAFVVE